MKNNLLSIDLSSSAAPKVQEVRGRDYIEYSDEDGLWKNLYPNFIIDLYYNSSTHAAIINSTAEMIAGEDLICSEEDYNLDAFVKLKKFLRNANSNETLHQVIKKVAFDFKLQGAYALHIVYNQARTEVAEVYHVPVERVRAGKPNEFGKVDTYYISSDWSNVRTHKPYPVAAFNTNDRTSGSQLIYTGSYSPNMDIYFTPDSLAGNNWALIDSKISEYHLNNINNGFSGSYMFSFNNGIPTEDERNKIERDITSKLTSAANAGKFLMSFSDDKTRAPEIHSLNAADLSEQYINLQTLIVQNILTAHRVTSKTLLGIDSADGFSSSADELLNAANFFQNQVIRPFQKNILGTLQKIFAVNQMDLPVEFIQLKPITIQFDSETIRDVMTTDEIRADLGLPDLTVEQEEEDFNTQLSEEVVEKTELDAFIEEFGEDMSEDWELVEEEVVDGEHQDFNYEEVLNELAGEKIELASTGRAIPSRKSEQDGISKKSYDYFRVRYVYSEDNFLSKEGKTREFCTKMTAAKKLYRKEDIINMGSKEVNKGWGPKGNSNTYSIWLWKGGGNCHHFWSRRIFKTVIGDSKTTKIEDADMIGYTKARSEGFTAKKNDKLVATPPKKMKNNGFLKPRS
jgi:hypothetical protein